MNAGPGSIPGAIALPSRSERPAWVTWWRPPSATRCCWPDRQPSPRCRRVPCSIGEPNATPPARMLIDNGAAVALATGYHPCECPSLNMQMTIALACRAMQMTAAEAIAASTINAAHAMRRARRIGSIESGKSADLLMLSVPDYRELPYHFGVNLVDLVMIRGAVLVERSEVKWPVRLIECVANFSEGRDARDGGAIEDAIRVVRGRGGAAIGNGHRSQSERDHVRRAAGCGGRRRAARDRGGAWSASICESMRACIRGWARRTLCRSCRWKARRWPIAWPSRGARAKRFGSGCDVPVYFYEAAAMSPDRRLLENCQARRVRESQDRAGFGRARAASFGGRVHHRRAKDSDRVQYESEDR